jgi:hypothetical protein
MKSMVLKAFGVHNKKRLRQKWVAMKNSKFMNVCPLPVLCNQLLGHVVDQMVQCWAANKELKDVNCINWSAAMC